LDACGVKDENVTIVFGTGAHRAVTRQEAIELLGEEMFNRVRSMSHNCKAADLVHVGRTRKFGTEVYLNRVFVEADVRILTGDVSFHYYAGYGGGRKSVMFPAETQ
jgi:nickel-dependent lactate racemase